MLAILPPAQVRRQFGEARLQQRQQSAEGILLAAAGRRRDQQQMPPGIFSDALDQLKTLMRAATAPISMRDAVRLINDDELRRIPQELVTAALGLDEISRYHRETVPLEDALARAQPAFQAGGSAR